MIWWIVYPPVCPYPIRGSTWSCGMSLFQHKETLLIWSHLGSISCLDEQRFGVFIPFFNRYLQTLLWSLVVIFLYYYEPDRVGHRTLILKYSSSWKVLPCNLYVYRETPNSMCWCWTAAPCSGWKTWKKEVVIRESGHHRVNILLLALSWSCRVTQFIVNPWVFSKSYSLSCFSIEIPVNPRNIEETPCFPISASLPFAKILCKKHAALLCIEISALKIFVLLDFCWCCYIQ